MVAAAELVRKVNANVRQARRCVRAYVPTHKPARPIAVHVAQPAAAVALAKAAPAHAHKAKPFAQEPVWIQSLALLTVGVATRNAPAAKDVSSEGVEENVPVLHSGSNVVTSAAAPVKTQTAALTVVNVLTNARVEEPARKGFANVHPVGFVAVARAETFRRTAFTVEPVTWLVPAVKFANQDNAQRARAMRRSAVEPAQIFKPTPNIAVLVTKHVQVERSVKVELVYAPQAKPTATGPARTYKPAHHTVAPVAKPVEMVPVLQEPAAVLQAKPYAAAPVWIQTPATLIVAAVGKHAPVGLARRESAPALQAKPCATGLASTPAPTFPTVEGVGKVAAEELVLQADATAPPVERSVQASV